MSVTPARGRQLSLFGVEAHPPTPLDLEGLLAGAGQVGRMGGTGRVSIVVEGAWRCAVLRAECELRGLAMTCEPTGDGDRWLVRTAYSAALAALAGRWLDEEGVKRTPAGLALEGRRLRLWVAAAGVYDGRRAYLLRLAPRRIPDPDPDPDPEPEPAAETDNGAETAGSGVSTGPSAGSTPNETLAAALEVTNVDAGPDEFAELEDLADDGRDEWPDSGVGHLPTVVLDPVSVLAEPEEIAPEGSTGRTDEVEAAIDRRVVDNWVAVGDALIAIGLPVVFIAPDVGGPAYRIVGPRRITRLAEMVGEPPPGAPVEDWPR